MKYSGEWIRTSTGVFNNQKGKVDNNNKFCKIIIKLIRSRSNIENIVIFDVTFIIIFLFNLLEFVS